MALEGGNAGETTIFGILLDTFSTWKDVADDVTGERANLQNLVETVLKNYQISLENRTLRSRDGADYIVDINCLFEEERHIVELKMFNETHSHHFRLKEILFDIMKLRSLLPISDVQSFKSVIIFCRNLEPEKIDQMLRSVKVFASVVDDHIVRRDFGLPTKPEGNISLINITV